MLWPKKTLISTQFGPNSTLFGVGGEGLLVLVISLERSQPFLASIVVINAKLLAVAAKKVQSMCRCTAVWKDQCNWLPHIASNPKAYFLGLMRHISTAVPAYRNEYGSDGLLKFRC